MKRRQLLAVVRDTFRELLVRKVLIGFLVLTALGLAGIALYLSGDTVTRIATAMRQEMTADVYQAIAFGLESGTVQFFREVLLLVGVFTTASVVPTMLEKGTVDLYLSKPLGRPFLLGAKALGSVAVVAANIAAFMLGAWLILSLKLGVWNAAFAGVAGVLLLSFAALYGVILILNVATRTGAVGLIAAMLIMMLLSPILANRAAFEASLGSVGSAVATAFYYLLPQTSEHGAIMHAVMMHGPVASWTPVWVAGAQVAGYFAFAAWLFQRKDY